MPRHRAGYVPVVRDRLLRPLTARWAWLRAVLRVQDRYEEVHGGYLAGAVTLAAFLSVFPLLVVGVAVVGFVSAGTDLPATVVARFGLTGDAASAVFGAVETARRSRRGALGVGTAGLLWSGLGLVAALQYAFDNTWQVTGRGMRDRLRGLVWLGGSAVLLVPSFALTALVHLSPWFTPVSIVLGLGLNVVLWLWTLKTLLAVDVPWRSLLRGAIVGAVGLEALKLVGAVYLPRAVASASALYGSIGVVFAIVAWLLLFGRLAVYVAVVNVVAWEDRHGTVTVEIDLPNHVDPEPVEATRSGEAKVREEAARD